MKTVPRICVHCGCTETKPHCDNIQCTWIKCDQCSKYTDARATAPEEG